MVVQSNSMDAVVGGSSTHWDVGSSRTYKFGISVMGAVIQFARQCACVVYGDLGT